jgi:aminopeptidase
MATGKKMHLTEKHLRRYADVLLWGLKTARTKQYRKNDIVLIRFDPRAVRLAEILQARVLDMGMHAILRMGLTCTMEENFYKKAGRQQLVFETPGERELCESLHGSIFLHAPESLTHLSEIDPKKIGITAVSRKPLREILEKREEAGEFGWTLCTLPTEELAKQAGLSITTYAKQIIKACYLDKRDPLSEWKSLYRQASAVKKWLNSMDVSSYHIESRRCDLKIRPGKMRKWIGISGHNIPSFEIFISPDWRGTEGHYWANQPSFRSGNYVEDVLLTFGKGRVIEAKAGKGEDFVVKQISMDRGASRVGEFSLTDRRFSRIDRFMADTLFDENFGGRYGNCHIALGASYSDTYAGNAAELTKKLKQKLGFNDSALHWDLVNTEDKTVTARLATGKSMIIYEKGLFRY